MRNVKLLDCTLRDGGYLIDAMFGDEVIRGMIKRLSDAGVDVIECGFLKDSPHEPGSSSFSDVEEVVPYLPVDRSRNTSYVLLADYSRYTGKTLKPFDGSSIDGIRECFQKHERKDAMNVARLIKEAGYKVYMQPVDILGYTDGELLELIHWVNELEPYSFSMVDTFGSMFLDDLHRLYSLVNHNLKPSVRIGFHSHNNLQMSAALSQEFITMAGALREVTVDATVCGMGRGAGNTNTELIADYLNRKHNYQYDLDILLDVIDVYMPDIQARCQWGYSVPTFIAGIYNTHVHNITYLIDKHNIDSKNMRQIIEKIESQTRKKYDYDNLEKIFINHMGRNIDDTSFVEQLQEEVCGKNVFIIAPGQSAIREKEKINAFIRQEKPLVITVNAVFPEYQTQYAFFSNFRRFEFAMENHRAAFLQTDKIVTSNIETDLKDRIHLINYNDYIKQGWTHFDNSTVMLLRLLLKLNVRQITLAGFDGYKTNPEENYSEGGLTIQRDPENYQLLNQEISEMLVDLRQHFSQVRFAFLTDSVYQSALEKRQGYYED